MYQDSAPGKSVYSASTYCTDVCCSRNCIGESKSGRSRDLRGHRPVRCKKAPVAAPFSALCFRHCLARSLGRPVCQAGSRMLAALPCRVDGLANRVVAPRGASHRRQDLAPGQNRRQARFTHRLGLAGVATAASGANQSRWEVHQNIILLCMIYFMTTGQNLFVDNNCKVHAAGARAGTGTDAMTDMHGGPCTRRCAAIRGRTGKSRRKEARSGF